jgi:uncharacterized protein
MTKKAVLDSSALVSAFFTPEGTPASLLAHARRGAFSLVSSVEILDEVTGVLMRPKHQARYRYTLEEVARYRELLAALSVLVTDLPALKAVPLDPNDDMIVATAVAARADYLVTGDRRHLIVLGHYESIRILSPRAFLSELRPDQA